MNCLVCGNKNEEEFSNYLSLDYLRQCQKCGFVFMAEVRQVKDYYQHKISREFDSTKQNSRFRNCQDRLKIFKKFINPNMDILDVGCNEGSFLKVAQDFGYKILGLEPNDRLLNYAKSCNLPVIQGTIEDFKTEKNFDVITLFNVLEHLKEPTATIRKIDSLLSPGGYLVLELPNIDSYLAKKLKENWEMITIEHLFYFSPKTIKIFLADKGFLIKKISIRQFDEWNLGIKDSLARLGLHSFKTKKQFQLSSPGPKITQNSKQRRTYLKPIRFLLSILVKIFRRGDYILIVAKKV